MWIFCGGMQRAGSTLQFQLTARLVEEAGRGKRVEWVKPDQFPALRQEHAGDEGWKVLSTHVCTDEIAREFDRGHAMAVYVFRDLRDVFVSAMTKYSETFDQLWASAFLEACVHEHKRWTRLPRVLVSRYEQMIVDLPGEVRRIADHLGIFLDPRAQAQIAAEHTLDKQRQRIADARKRGGLREAYPNGPLFDPHSNLHMDHLYSGGSGGWKDVLTREQVALIEDRFRDWLITNGYPLTLRPLQRTLLKCRHRFSPATYLPAVKRRLKRAAGA
jgi:hypothetical protein